ncbi:MAG: histidine kinase, partial [Trebonia sp.]
MTTRGGISLAFPMRRWIARWPALLLPLVAVGTIGLVGTPVPEVLIVLAVCLAVAVPAESAKIAPYALFGYGAYGLFKLHSLETYESIPVRYGVVIPGPTGSTAMFAEALLFLVLAACVLAVNDAPGGRAIRRAVSQLRGSNGQPKTVPPLLLLAALFLWEELLSSQLWFGSGWQNPGRTFAVAAFAVGLVVVRARPRAAAAASVAGIVAFGMFGVLSGLHWALYGAGYPLTYMLYGAVPFADGPLALIQGIALTAVGCLLAPRLLTWQGDAELARRAQALTQRVGRLTQTRSDATEVAVAELRRIERDLHDGAQARLVAVGMSLRAAEQLMASSPDAALALVAEARETSS